MASYQFTDAGGDHLWTNPANWNPAGPAGGPLAGGNPQTDTITFAAGKICILNCNITLAAGGGVQYNTTFTQNAGATITNSGGSWNSATCNGGSYTYNGAFTQASGTSVLLYGNGAFSVAGAVTINGGTFTLCDSGVINGTITSTGALTFAAAATCYLSRRNNGGTLNVNGSVTTAGALTACTAMGGGSGTTVNFSSGSSLIYSNGASGGIVDYAAGVVNFATGSTLTLNTGTTFAIMSSTCTAGAAVTLAGAVNINGTTIVTLSNNSGAFTISTGAAITVATTAGLYLSNTTLGGFFTWSGGSITVLAGGSFQWLLKCTVSITGSPSLSLYGFAVAVQQQLMATLQITPGPANTMLLLAPPGSNWYLHILGSGGWWNGATFEAFNVAHWASYSIAATDASGIGLYQASLPTLPAGSYDVFAFRRGTAVVAVGDAPALTVNRVSWDGVTLVSVADTTGIASAVWAIGTRSLTDKAGFALADGSIKTATFAAGAIDGTVAPNLDAAISTRLAGSAYVAPDNNAIVAIKVQTDKLQFTAHGDGTFDVRANAGLTVDNAAIATAVWAAEARSLTDKAGFALADGSIATATFSAGAIDNSVAPALDAAISTRMASFLYTAPDNAGIGSAIAGIGLVKAQTDKLHFTDHGDGSFDVQTDSSGIVVDNAAIATAVWANGTRTLTTAITSWTDTEKGQIRYALGMDGARTATSGDGVTDNINRSASKLQFNSEGDVIASLAGEAVALNPIQNFNNVGQTDEVPAGDSMLRGRLTDARANRIDNLDTRVSTRSSHSPSDVWSFNDRRLTSFGTLVADTVNAVWGAGSRTLTGFGFLVTDIWSAVSRTITGGSTDLSAQAKVDMKTAAASALADYDPATRQEGAFDRDQIITQVQQAMAQVAPAPDAGTIAAAVDSLLTTKHGDGDWRDLSHGVGPVTYTVRVSDGTNPIALASVRLTSRMSSGRNRWETSCLGRLPVRRSGREPPRRLREMPQGPQAASSQAAALRPPGGRSPAAMPQVQAPPRWLRAAPQEPSGTSDVHAGRARYPRRHGWRAYRDADAG